MKMLTLGACREPAEGPAAGSLSEQPLAWKQAWKKAIEPVPIPAAERGHAEIVPPRHPVT